jgi:hypothetical protein
VLGVPTLLLIALHWFQENRRGPDADAGACTDLRREES